MVQRVLAQRGQQIEECKQEAARLGRELQMLRESQQSQDRQKQIVQLRREIEVKKMEVGKQRQRV
jgi:hypothetical protein